MTGQTAHTSDMPAGVVDVKEAAILLGVSTRTVFRYIAEGKLEHYRTPGGRVRIYRTAIDRWLPTPH